MRTTIDAAGRIVVPKALRDEVGLTPGQAVEISAADGRLEISVPTASVRLEDHGRGLVAVPAEPLPELTAKQVRETLERVRR